MDSASASTQSLQETDEYVFFDPRAPRNAGATASTGAGNRARRMAFTDGIVFVVGGVGYVEYGNLQECVGRVGKRVTYGGTEIIDPGAFVSILAGLGKSAS